MVCHSYEAIGCCKHASVYSLDNYTNSEGVQVTRMSFNAVVEPSDMKQTCALLLCASVVSRGSPPAVAVPRYMPAFQTCIQEGKARSVMCRYGVISALQRLHAPTTMC